MDVQEKKAFEAWIKNEDPFAGNDAAPDCIWAKKYMWKAWQAAKAHAVLEGFVLVEKNLIKTLHEELLDHEPDSFVVNRDICELWKQANDH